MMELQVGPRHCIDLNAPPRVQEDRWKPLHTRQGFMRWEPERFKPYLTRKQRRGWSGLSGVRLRESLRRELRGFPILNASALEHLLVHQELIPAGFRHFTLCFWGTSYFEHKGDEFIRCLHWREGAWEDVDILVNGYGWTNLCAAARYDGLRDRSDLPVPARIP